MTVIAENTFAACYNDCTIEELAVALVYPADETDMRTWGLTEAGWRERIQIAIDALREDAE